MDLFGSSNIEKMVTEHDMDGLYKLLEHRNTATRLEAALALAELNDGAGWRFLMDTVRQTEDVESQATAAAMLGDLGHPRAIPVLEEALKNARLKTDRETAQVLKDSLEAIGGRDADDALRRAGYEPVLPHMAGNLQVVDYDGEYVPTLMPDTTQIEFLTAEQHMNNAVSLRESEFAERGLVEDSLALWLAPEMAYAWYLRGVLYEDLERSFEASLCYRWALELDPSQVDAREALNDLEKEALLPALDPDLLMADLSARDWSERRDAAAGLGELGEKVPESVVDRLIELLDDDDREVRHAAMEALGNIGDKRAVLPLSEREENSWLLRFALIEALAQLGSVDGLVAVLQREMNRDQMRNPVFSSQKDPLLEVEYSRLMEIGVLAFEKTGDLQGLLVMAENNAWVEVDEDEETAEEDDGAGEGYVSGEEEYADGDEDLEADEDLASYVDEVAQMASLALERLATPALPGLDVATLQRLADVPDFSLLEVSSDEEEEDADEETELSEPELTIIHDLSALREAAKAELAKR
jgi:HEAT repeat protein